MNRSILFLVLSVCVLSACSADKRTSHVWLSSQQGDKCAEQQAIVFRKMTMDDAVVIYPDKTRQEIDGFGGSLTESSAFVLACLSQDERGLILNELFGDEGANYSLVRTQIGASDFSVEGKYSLAEQDGDTSLVSFSLDRDKEGFARSRYPEIKDEKYDLYHLMHEVAAIKQKSRDKDYRIVANTWTAPAWMKDNKKYYERENGFHRGGKLLEQYYRTYAQYLARYIEAWKSEGVDIWAITPVNEPMGNDGGWESMDMSPEEEALFIGRYLKPILRERGLDDVVIMGFDQNIFEMQPYVDAIYGDSLSGEATSGMAVHWYGSTIDCFPEVLDSVHALHPDKRILHTEGCIDNLGCPGWPGVGDMAGYQESGWFGNDDFWWTASATDWAYSTQWASDTHPAYAPVHRYARYIIEGMNHWLTGFIDWNIVLDSIGGPNHVNNFCGAQVMVDYKNDSIYFTPYYYVLKQFSRSMRPGDHVVSLTRPASIPQTIHICASRNESGTIAINILNRGQATDFPIQIGKYAASISMPANAVKTILVPYE